MENFQDVRELANTDTQTEQRECVEVEIQAVPETSEIALQEAPVCDSNETQTLNILIDYGVQTDTMIAAATCQTESATHVGRSVQTRITSTVDPREYKKQQEDIIEKTRNEYIRAKEERAAAAKDADFSLLTEEERNHLKEKLAEIRLEKVKQLKEEGLPVEFDPVEERLALLNELRGVHLQKLKEAGSVPEDVDVEAAVAIIKEKHQLANGFERLRVLEGMEVELEAKGDTEALQEVIEEKTALLDEINWHMKRLIEAGVIPADTELHDLERFFQSQEERDRLQAEQAALRAMEITAEEVPLEQLEAGIDFDDLLNAVKSGMQTPEIAEEMELFASSAETQTDVVLVDSSTQPEVSMFRPVPSVGADEASNASAPEGVRYLVDVGTMHDHALTSHESGTQPEVSMFRRIPTDVSQAPEGIDYHAAVEEIRFMVDTGIQPELSLFVRSDEEIAAVGSDAESLRFLVDVGIQPEVSILRRQAATERKEETAGAGRSDDDDIRFLVDSGTQPELSMFAHSAEQLTAAGFDVEAVRFMTDSSTDTTVAFRDYGIQPEVSILRRLERMDLEEEGTDAGSSETEGVRFLVDSGTQPELSMFVHSAEQLTAAGFDMDVVRFMTESSTDTTVAFRDYGIQPEVSILRRPQRTEREDGGADAIGSETEGIRFLVESGTQPELSMFAHSTEQLAAAGVDIDTVRFMTDSSTATTVEFRDFGVQPEVSILRRIDGGKPLSDEGRTPGESYEEEVRFLVDAGVQPEVTMFAQSTEQLASAGMHADQIRYFVDSSTEHDPSITSTDVGIQPEVSILRRTQVAEATGRIEEAGGDESVRYLVDTGTQPELSLFLHSVDDIAESGLDADDLRFMVNTSTDPDPSLNNREVGIQPEVSMIRRDSVRATQDGTPLEVEGLRFMVDSSVQPEVSMFRQVAPTELADQDTRQDGEELRFMVDSGVQSELSLLVRPVDPADDVKMAEEGIRYLVEVATEPDKRTYNDMASQPEVSMFRQAEGVQEAGEDVSFATEGLRFMVDSSIQSELSLFHRPADELTSSEMEAAGVRYMVDASTEHDPSQTSRDSSVQPEVSSLFHRALESELSMFLRQTDDVLPDVLESEGIRFLVEASTEQDVSMACRENGTQPEVSMFYRKKETDAGLTEAVALDEEPSDQLRYIVDTGTQPEVSMFVRSADERAELNADDGETLRYLVEASSGPNRSMELRDSAVQPEVSMLRQRAIEGTAIPEDQPGSDEDGVRYMVDAGTMQDPSMISREFGTQPEVSMFRRQPTVPLEVGSDTPAQTAEELRFMMDTSTQPEVSMFQPPPGGEVTEQDSGIRFMTDCSTQYEPDTCEIGTQPEVTMFRMDAASVPASEAEQLRFMLDSSTQHEVISVDAGIQPELSTVASATAEGGSAVDAGIRFLVDSSVQHETEHLEMGTQPEVSMFRAAPEAAQTMGGVRFMTEAGTQAAMEYHSISIQSDISMFILTAEQAREEPGIRFMTDSETQYESQLRNIEVQSEVSMFSVTAEQAHSEPGVRFMAEASSQFELVATEVGIQPEVSMFAATAEQENQDLGIRFMSDSSTDPEVTMFRVSSDQLEEIDTVGAPISFLVDRSSQADVSMFTATSEQESNELGIRFMTDSSTDPEVTMFRVSSDELEALNTGDVPVSFLVDRSSQAEVSMFAVTAEEAAGQAPTDEGIRFMVDGYVQHDIAVQDRGVQPEVTMFAVSEAQLADNTTIRFMTENGAQTDSPLVPPVTRIRRRSDGTSEAIQPTVAPTDMREPVEIYVEDRSQQTVVAEKKEKATSSRSLEKRKAISTQTPPEVPPKRLERQTSVDSNELDPLDIDLRARQEPETDPWSDFDPEIRQNIAKVLIQMRPTTKDSKAQTATVPASAEPGQLLPSLQDIEKFKVTEDVETQTTVKLKKKAPKPKGRSVEIQTDSTALACEDIATQTVTKLKKKPPKAEMIEEQTQTLPPSEQATSDAGTQTVLKLKKKTPKAEAAAIAVQTEDVGQPVASSVAIQVDASTFVHVESISTQTDLHAPPKEPKPKRAVKGRKSAIVQTEPVELDSVDVQTESILLEETATQTMPWRMIKKERIPLLHEQQESEEYVPGAALKKLLAPSIPDNKTTCRRSCRLLQDLASREYHKGALTEKTRLELEDRRETNMALRYSKVDHRTG
ncbi:hypothetical protein AAVH_14148 [Aphelenchoides avenae]|nr:hypothetical protein AAVH_14148 [Aphelenchus avenae]